MHCGEERTGIMQITFVSNYINHHQIPFSNALFELTKGGYTFVQTQVMEQERVQMGWQAEELPYVKFFYEEPDVCKQLIMDSDVVIFGGTDDESYIEERLEAARLTLRYSERLYKTGQWKAVSPRGLRKKYHDHTRHRNAPVYLLCAGAYVPSDFHIVRAYTGKMFCWGYFPETKQYDVDKLIAEKNGQIPRLLWAGRFIDWKHPELALETARYLKEKGIRFHMDIIGGGPMEAQLKELLHQYELEQCVEMLGFKSPGEVRAYMEQANIHLFTSDRQEGWGAVANESMNSGCAIVANHMIGAVPYLIRHGENGFVYRDGAPQMLFETVERLVLDSELRSRVGRAAYETIVSTWNAEDAAASLYHLILELTGRKDAEAKEVLTDKDCKGFYPGMPAPVISERKMFDFLMQEAKFRENKKKLLGNT